MSCHSVGLHWSSESRTHRETVAVFAPLAVRPQLAEQRESLSFRSSAHLEAEEGFMLLSDDCCTIDKKRERRRVEKKRRRSKEMKEALALPVPPNTLNRSEFNNPRLVFQFT